MRSHRWAYSLSSNSACSAAVAGGLSVLLVLLVLLVLVVLAVSSLLSSRKARRKPLMKKKESTANRPALRYKHITSRHSVNEIGV